MCHQPCHAQSPSLPIEPDRRDLTDAAAAFSLAETRGRDGGGAWAGARGGRTRADSEEPARAARRLDFSAGPDSEGPGPSAGPGPVDRLQVERPGAAGGPASSFELPAGMPELRGSCADRAQAAWLAVMDRPGSETETRICLGVGPLAARRARLSRSLRIRRPDPEAPGTRLGRLKFRSSSGGRAMQPQHPCDRRPFSPSPAPPRAPARQCESLAGRRWALPAGRRAGLAGGRRWGSHCDRSLIWGRLRRGAARRGPAWRAGEAPSTPSLDQPGPARPPPPLPPPRPSRPGPGAGGTNPPLPRAGVYEHGFHPFSDLGRLASLDALRAGSGGFTTYTTTPLELYCHRLRAEV